jgi:DNA-binding Xre family transcriptional regulator
MNQHLMTVAQIRSALQAVSNLSQLARDTNIELRTLRRIRNGQAKDIMASTAELLSSHLQEQQQPRGRK